MSFYPKASESFLIANQEERMQKAFRQLQCRTWLSKDCVSIWRISNPDFISHSPPATFPAPPSGHRQGRRCHPGGWRFRTFIPAAIVGIITNNILISPEFAGQKTSCIVRAYCIRPQTIHNCHGRIRQRRDKCNTLLP